MAETISLQRALECVAQAAGRYSVRLAGVFGSVARGEESYQSDLDVFADFDTSATAHDKCGFSAALSQLLPGISIDVVTTLKGASPQFISNFKRDAVIAYER